MNVTDQRRSELAEAFQRYSEFPMLCLALAFIPVLIVPWFFDLSPSWSAAFNTANGLIWAAFALELVIKVYLAPSRARYVTQHWFDVIIVVIPFLRPLRIAQSARILRAGRAMRLTSIAARSAHSLRELLAEHGLHYVLAVGVLLVVASAAGVTIVERGEGGNIQNFGDGLWWAVTTVTTVGYGDRFPVSAEGRAIAAFLMLLGISLFSFVTANIAAFLAKQNTDDSPTLSDLKQQLDRLETLIRESQRA